MWFHSLLSASANNRTHKRPSRRSIRPILETLESRLTPAVFNVAASDVASLIADMNTANSNGQSNTINLTASTYDLLNIDNYWYGPNGLPAISSNLTIHGNGAVLQRDSDANGEFRLFYVSGGMELSAGSLTMDNVTLEGGIAKGGDSNAGGGGMGAGGAIFNQGTLTLSAVTLTNNEALGGSSGDGGAGNGGGGMGGGSPALDSNGGGFGGSLGGTYGGVGGGGGGGGFVAGANGSDSQGGGKGGFANLGEGDGGNGNSNQGSDGDFGNGGSGGSGGGGGVGGGGGDGASNLVGSGGFGGGGGSGGSNSVVGKGGFGGGGGGGEGSGGSGGSGGFGAGNGSSGTGGGGAGLGGAIFNMGADSADAGSGQATLINCTLTANTAQGGDAIIIDTGSNAGAPGNGYGGAIFNLDGQVVLQDDTVAANTVKDGSGAATGGAAGGAVYNLGYGHDIDTGAKVSATLVLNNSILAASSGGSDLASQAFAIDEGISDDASISGSNNLVMSNGGGIAAGVIASTADPQLGLLQNNGGLTPTMLPSTGSPVLGAGDPALLLPPISADNPAPLPALATWGPSNSRRHRPAAAVRQAKTTTTTTTATTRTICLAPR